MQHGARFSISMASEQKCDEKTPHLVLANPSGISTSRSWLRRPKTTPMLHGARFFFLFLPRFAFVCVFSRFPKSPLKRKLSSADCSIFLHIFPTLFLDIVFSPRTFWTILTPMLGGVHYFHVFLTFSVGPPPGSAEVHFSRKTVKLEYQSRNALFRLILASGGASREHRFRSTISLKSWFSVALFRLFFFLPKI